MALPISNELFYYGGIALAGLALFAGIISAFVIKIRTMRLHTRFDQEYGEKQ